MLQFFRSNAQGMLGKVIVGAIVIVFTLWGAQSIVEISTTNNAPVSVNGVDISEYEIAKLTDIQRRNIQAQMGDSFDPSLISDAMIRQGVIQNLVSQELEWQTANDYGLAMSDEEVTQVIVNTPTFQVEGKFDQDAYTRILGQYGYTPQEYKELVRQDLMNFQLKQSLLDTGFVLDHELKQVASLESQTRNFAMFSFEPADFLGSVEIMDGDIEAYYEENKGQYRTAEQVKVDYVLIDRNKIAANFDVDDSEIEQAYDNYVAQQSGNSDKTVAHILVEDKSLAEDLKDQLDLGADFAALAQEHSIDPGSAEMGGDLGVFMPGLFVESFEQAVEALNSEGQVAGPVKSDFGYHLIKLTALSEAEVDSLESQRGRLEAQILDRKVADEMLVLQEDVTNLAFSESDLTAISEQFDVPVATSDWFGRATGTGFFSDAGVVGAAFDSVVTQDNENSEVVSLSDGSLVVMHLNDYQPSDYLPLDDVRSEIEQLIRADLAEQEALNAAQALQDDFAASGSIEGFEAWISYANVGRGDNEVGPDVITEVFRMAKPAEGGLTLSQVSRVDGSVAVIALQQVNAGSESITEELAGIRQYLDSLLSETDYEQWFESIARNAEIDYR